VIHYDYRGAHIRVHGIRQDSPPKMMHIDYEIEVDSGENDRNGQ